MIVIDVEAPAAVECPDGRRGAAALACTKDREFVGMGVVVIRNPKLSLYFVHCISKHITLNAGNVSVESVGTCYYTRDGWNDTVKAGSCIIAELDVGKSCSKGVVHLEDFNHDGVMGGPCRATAVAAWVQGFRILAHVHKSAELDAKKETIVGFIEVDDSKSVYTRVSGFLFYHCIYNLVPAVETVTLAD
jgi:hypothetical protein